MSSAGVVVNDDSSDCSDQEVTTTSSKGGVAYNGQFPWKLHEMLDYVEEKGLEAIVSWQPHGRAFRVHKPKVFAKDVMPRFFGQVKYASFQRQLNLYGFNRFCHGVDKGAYYHSCMIRGSPEAVRGMIRRKIKGKHAQAYLLSSGEEPDFYLLPFAQKSPPKKEEPEETKIRYRCWSEEEKGAVKAGVKLFKVGNWMHIKKYYPEILRHRTAVQIKDVWRTMLRNGEAYENMDKESGGNEESKDADTQPIRHASHNGVINPSTSQRLQDADAQSIHLPFQNGSVDPSMSQRLRHLQLLQLQGAQSIRLPFQNGGSINPFSRMSDPNINYGFSTSVYPTANALLSVPNSADSQSLLLLKYMMIKNMMNR